MLYFWSWEKLSVFLLFRLCFESKIHYIVTFKNILKAGSKKYKLSGVTFYSSLLHTNFCTVSECTHRGAHCELDCPVVVLNVLCPPMPLLLRL